MTEIIKILETWHRIENDGSGDYYLVPVGLFEYTLDEAFEKDPNFEQKFQKCFYIGGFASCVQVRGEFKRE